MVLAMKILVCVKEILAPESELSLAAGGGRIEPLGPPERRLGRYDACALEAALQLGEQRAEVQVQVATVGPPEAAEGLRRALGMGAETAWQVVSPDAVGDPFQVAAALAAAAMPASYDLILAGAMSEDLMQGAVGPSLASLLDLPCATEAVAFRIDADGTSLTVEEELEHGERNIVRLRLPAVLTVQTGAWTPRYPSLSGLMRARRQTIRTLDMAALVCGPPRRRTVGFLLPPHTRQGRILDGSPVEKAARLAKIFKDRGLVTGAGP